MSRSAADLLPTRGTRFKLLAVPASMGGRPEVVHVGGRIRPGPADGDIQVIRTRDLKIPYRHPSTGRPLWTPPLPLGERLPPLGARRGHFDAWAPGTQEFGATAAFATVRMVLLVWEHYLDRPLLPWFFARSHDRLELLPHVRSDNAWSGEGFIELGFRDPRTREMPYCEEFDIVAHETGHLILRTVMGAVADDRRPLAVRAHEEAAADMVALLAGLHFDSMVDRLLAETRGRLFSKNILSDIGGYRRLFNPNRFTKTMRQQAWTDFDQHTYALPFSGACFDLLVEVFERHLVARGAIPRALAGRSRHRPGRALPRAERVYQVAHFREAFGRRPEAFKVALLDARDDLGRLLAHAWRLGAAPGFSFATAVANLLRADRALFGGRHGAMIRATFAGRGIEADPGHRDLPPPR
ncbi:MAG: hypothetical protein L0027_17165 [Candidatus Rokubacteria bacterium]|nr:hypothetical protein [Candidatus Rokubacteria bacterium]